jgi:hypothetical protein
MTNPKIDVFDIETKKSFKLTLSDEEIAQRELTHDIEQAASEAKAATRASALAKLAELGLTQEEIAAL